MPIKSILLHMANDDRHGARLQAAAALARRFGAFVEVVYIATPLSMPTTIRGRGAAYAFSGEATAIALEKAGTVEAEVSHALKDCSFSWSVEEGEHVPILAARAAYADLTVVTQAHPADDDDRIVLQEPDRLPLESPCPTLVLPAAMPVGQPFGGHVLIAWKNTRESTLAVRNALPFLTAAERVTVLTLHRPDHPAEDPAHDLMVYLERHGVRTHHHAHARGDEDVGTAILGEASQLGADLLVMGAYGHSRLREVVLGGATRSILRQMDLPVLMSH